MAWPTMSDYQETIQNPHTCFSDQELKNGTPILNNLGLPKPIAGGFACVYQMICGSQNYAVRCFLTKQLDLEKRYKIISDYLRQVNLSYIISFAFISQGIRVNGQWFPILKMEWINGEPLNIYLARNLHKPQKLEALASNFTTLIEDLGKYDIAHGDLQHENILISNGQLKLIDYDGLYVPGLEATPSSEYGHRNYQHPLRSEKDFGPNLDSFSAWVIKTSILALCVAPQLWDQFEAGDGSLIFRKEDFLDPNHSLAFKLFEESRIVSLQSFSKQLKFLLKTNDLSKIPPLSTSFFSPGTNSQNVSPQGLPSWLKDYVEIQTSIANNPREPRSDGTFLIFEHLGIKFANKFKSQKRNNLKLSIWVGLNSITSFFFKKRNIKQTKQLNKGLQNYILEASSVPGIGPQLIIALNNAGITTAADIAKIHIVKNNLNPTKVALIEVSGKGITRIEGIGPVKAQALLEWKTLLEAKLNNPLRSPVSQLNALKTKYEYYLNLLLKEISQLMLEFAKRI